MLQVLLRKQGFGVTGAATGAAAVGLIERRHFDLMLLDLALPDMSGLEVLGRINDGRPAPPVVVITGNGMDFPEALEAMRWSAVGQLGKPFQLPGLEAEIGRVLGLPPEAGGEKEAFQKNCEML